MIFFCGRMRGVMNETFLEVLVKRKTPVTMKVGQVLLIILTVLLALLSLGTGAVVLLLAVLTGVGAYFTGLLSNVEYEYSYLNKELDVDVIYSMQRRKHLVTYDLTKLEVLAPVSSYHLDAYKNRNVKTKDFSSQKAENQNEVYVMYIGGNDKVVFEPTPELIKAIANIAPRKVFTE